jgi:hypothetical protein
MRATTGTIPILEWSGRVLRRAAPLMVLWLGFLASISRASAAEVEEEMSDADWFRSYCVDYYSLAECDAALLFIRKTFGLRYIESLNANEDPQSYLASLRMVIEGGRQMSSAQAAIARRN